MTRQPTPKQEIEQLASLADEAKKKRDYAEATRLAMECYERSVALDFRHGIGRALLELGEILYQQEKAYMDAFRFFLRAKKMVKGGWYIPALESYQDARRRLKEKEMWEENFEKDKTPHEQLVAEYKEKYLR